MSSSKMLAWSSKTSILPKDVTNQVAFDVVKNIMQEPPTLVYLIGDVLLASFCHEGFVGIGVPIGTDAFVQNFVSKTCRTIIDEVEKLDTIQDGSYIIHSSGFGRPLDSNILILIFCSVIFASCNSNM
jgi:hypothetical protein